MEKYNGEKDLDLNGKKILLFSADWCGDCIYLNMFIDEIVEENKEWEFIYIDVDNFPLLAQQYNILGIPSFVAIENNKVVSELISKDRKTKSLINSWIKTIGKI